MMAGRNEHASSKSVVEFARPRRSRAGSAWPQQRVNHAYVGDDRKPLRTVSTWIRFVDGLDWKCGRAWVATRSAAGGTDDQTYEFRCTARATTLTAARQPDINNKTAAFIVKSGMWSLLNQFVCLSLGASDACCMQCVVLRIGGMPGGDVKSLYCSNNLLVHTNLHVEGPQLWTRRSDVASKPCKQSNTISLYDNDKKLE